METFCPFLVLFCFNVSACFLNPIKGNIPYWHVSRFSYEDAYAISGADVTPSAKQVASEVARVSEERLPFFEKLSRVHFATNNRSPVWITRPAIR